MFYLAVRAVLLVATWKSLFRHPACLTIWTAANGIWVWFDISRGLPHQAVVQVAFYCLSLYGYFRWVKKLGPRYDATGLPESPPPAAGPDP